MAFASFFVSLSVISTSSLFLTANLFVEVSCYQNIVLPNVFHNVVLPSCNRKHSNLSRSEFAGANLYKNLNLKAS